MNNQLNHHGIKGQKWGVRRFQNEDGSLTSAGKKQLNKSAKKADLKDAKKLVRADNFKKNIKRTGIILGTIGSLSALGIAQEANRSGKSFGRVGKEFIDSIKFSAKFAASYVTSSPQEKQWLRGK